MTQQQKILCKYKNAHDIVRLLHSAGGHQGSCKAHQAGNQHDEVNESTNSYSKSLQCWNISFRQKGCSGLQLKVDFGLICCTNTIQCSSINYLSCHWWIIIQLSAVIKWVGGGCCFNNVSWALQNILLVFMNCRNHNSYENFKVKLCMCAHSMALDAHKKFELEILAINVIFGIISFCKIILESLRNVCETTSWLFWENKDNNMFDHAFDLRITKSATTMVLDLWDTQVSKGLIDKMSIMRKIFNFLH